MLAEIMPKLNVILLLQIRELIQISLFLLIPQMSYMDFVG